MRVVFPVLLITGCSEGQLPPGSGPPGALSLVGSGAEVRQQADVTVVREGVDLVVTIADDITHDMYGREVSPLAIQKRRTEVCTTEESGEDLVDWVRNAPIGEHITCPDPYVSQGTMASGDGTTLGADAVVDTILLDVVFGVLGTHEYYHFLEVVVADPDAGVTNSEVVVR